MYKLHSTERIMLRAFIYYRYRSHLCKKATRTCSATLKCTVFNKSNNIDFTACSTFVRNDLAWLFQWNQQTYLVPWLLLNFQWHYISIKSMKILYFFAFMKILHRLRINLEMFPIVETAFITILNNAKLSSIHTRDCRSFLSVKERNLWRKKHQMRLSRPLIYCLK